MPIRHLKTVILIAFILILAVHVQALVEPGRIVVTSKPSGAVACINTVYCDTTDATFTVTGNTWHSIVITEKGYVPWTGTVFVVSNQNTWVNAQLVINPSATVIQVDVTPGGGTVCLDNSQCHTNVGAGSGTGSTQFTGASEGYHTITVESPAGYLDYYAPVYVNLARTTYVTIDLKPLISSPAQVAPVVTPDTGTGVVRVYVDRTGSTICLDNVNCRMNVGGTASPVTGTTLFYNVTANTVHQVSVSANGYKPYSSQVTVGKDLITTVDVALQPLTTPTQAAPLALATTEPTPQPQPTRSAPGVVPALGALVLCGALFWFRKIGR